VSSISDSTRKVGPPAGRRPFTLGFDPCRLRNLTRSIIVATVAVVLALSPPSSVVPTSAAAVVKPDPAPTLQADIRSYLAGRSVSASVRVRDLQTGRRYTYRSRVHHDSASIVKVAIMAAVLRRQSQQGRYLTDRENRLLHKMIQRSNNAATSKLWKSLGRGPAMARFYATAGMRHSTPGPGRYWGLTQITAADEVVLLRHLTRKTALLTKAGREYARSLMATVKPSQAWGISAGPTDTTSVTVELKNGWLQRSQRRWRIHSIGHVSGEGRNYLVAILTTNNRTQAEGIATVEAISRLIWQDLDPPPQE
jgi:hypothetical protein